MTIGPPAVSGPGWADAGAFSGGDRSSCSQTKAGAAAHDLPPRIAAALLDQSRAAFTSGMHVTATISAVLLAGVAVVAVILLRPARPYGQAVSAAGPGEEQAEAVVLDLTAAS